MARRTRWIDTLVAESTTNLGQDIESLLAGMSTDSTRGLTVTRVIGDLWLSSGTVAGAWGTQQVSIGIGVVSQEAFVANAIPDPNNNADYPVRGWIYRTCCGVAQNGTGTQVLYRCVFDIRSQRKLDSGELLLVINNDAGLGTSFTVQTFGSVRVLALLP